MALFISIMMVALSGDAVADSELNCEKKRLGVYEQILCERERLAAERKHAEEEAKMVADQPEVTAQVEAQIEAELTALEADAASWRLVHERLDATLLSSTPDESGSLKIGFAYKLPEGAEVTRTDDGYIAFSWSVNPEAERLAKEEAQKKADEEMGAKLKKLEDQLAALEAERQVLLEGDAIANPPTPGPPADLNDENPPTP